MTDYLRKYKSLFSTTLASGIGTGTGDTLTLSSVTGLPTDTPITITVDRVDSEGNTTPTKLERITGTISGSNLTSYTRGVDGTTEQAHSAGAVVEMIFNAEDWNDVVDWGLVEHDQDGTHKSTLVTTLKATGAEVNTGTEDAKIVTPKALTDAGLALIDEDNMASNSAVKVPTQQSVKAYVDANGSIMSITKYAPAGFLINGKIVPSVASNNLTVAIKGMDGNDPSASNPVYCRIGDTVRTITAALSVTKNAGTNWCNAGGAEIATKEVDYFVYLGYNATDGVVIGFSRIPWASEYDDFSATAANEKYCAISTITNAAAGDDYELIGRFAATLSAGAGYTWTVPTFTNKNLIQRPIFNTRFLIWNAVLKGTPDTSSLSQSSSYRMDYNAMSISIFAALTKAGSPSGTFGLSLPFTHNDNVSNMIRPFAGTIAANGANPLTASKGMPYVITTAPTEIRFLSATGAAELGWAATANLDTIHINGSYQI